MLTHSKTRFMPINKKCSRCVNFYSVYLEKCTCIEKEIKSIKKHIRQKTKQKYENWPRKHRRRKGKETLQEPGPRNPYWESPSRVRLLHTAGEKYIVKMTCFSQKKKVRMTCH